MTAAATDREDRVKPCPGCGVNRPTKNDNNSNTSRNQRSGMCRSCYAKPWPGRNASTWIRYAACAGENLDLFYPPLGADGTAAKTICQECPVRVECLTYALNNNEQYGVWGGLSPAERALIRRRARRAS